ncbi:glycosyl transferase [Marinomonas posidonica]|uniref:Glycosyl transferase family 17 n=1 Tax=Marinomonas posidonica (strain CECT 7376 / NCIMB 14433 / IVIA-Po-181) TaxID=491952 RepID=F6CZ89_MARPP|nr:glycosyl transferase [Marinomonas posidonica]AEF53545.1 glycosyl transferase family 17 [Marinomonas posidonica IVIA-Po-181]
MPKIIDSFLFFQELDLLEIRLSYLYEYVDAFLIVEACQTFTGKPKEFVFEKNKKRFEKYSSKIIYYKIEDSHDNYASIVEFLTNKNTDSSLRVLSILESHQHYSKDQIHWVLDSYHRECLHIPMADFDDDDIILVSDLDEIPSISTFSDSQKEKEKIKPYVYQQHEFRYFLDYYKATDWLGTISSRYSLIKNTSFNLLRMDSKIIRNLVSKDSVKNAGYHFTSCGGIEMIKEKIQSWGHQEFNNPLILSNLEKNINEGRDIFMRDSGTNLTRVALNDKHFFDSEISIILERYQDLISVRDINIQTDSYLKRITQKTTLNLFKLIYKIKILLKKIV